MYYENPAFDPPADPETRLGRYMDFTKLVSLLERRALFFVKASALEDPFEGRYPNPTAAELVAEPREMGVDDPSSEDAFTPQGFLRDCICVNSWHMSDHESAAMWRQYLQAQEGIAVLSTYQRLCDGFERAVQ